MNIAEILKYCPKGTKLYSTAFGEVELIGTSSLTNTILVQNIHNTPFTFYSDGSYTLDEECVLFPSKDQRDWSKFRLPVKKGDIMMKVNGDCVFITTGELFDNISPKYICGINSCDEFEIYSGEGGWTTGFYIPASEEAKKKLFDKMAEAGYKWNTDTLELEKIKPCFKEGDVIVDSDGYLFLSTGVIKDDKIQVCCLFTDGTFVNCGVSMHPSPISSLKLASVDDRNNVYSLLVKKGYKYDKKLHNIVKQDFKPFDRVLVRDKDTDPWKADIYLDYEGENRCCRYKCARMNYVFCIPYEGNEYLLGTTN